jgi:hypothetical protein
LFIRNNLEYQCLPNCSQLVVASSALATPVLSFSPPKTENDGLQTPPPTITHINKEDILISHNKLKRRARYALDVA